MKAGLSPKLRSVARFGFAFVSVLAPAYGQFATWFEDASTPSVPFESGVVVADQYFGSSGPGFSLVAFEEPTGVGDSYSTSLVSFDSSGNMRWGYRLVSDEGVDPQLATSFDAGSVFAFYQGETHSHVGRFATSDLTPEYQFKLEMGTEPGRRFDTLFEDESLAIVQDLGGSVRVTVVGEDGVIDFEKDYGSTLLDPEAGVGDQVAYLVQNPDASGYVLTVSFSGAQSVDETTSEVSWSNQFLTVFIDNSGLVVGARSFTLPTDYGLALMTVASSRVLANGSVVYLMTGTSSMGQADSYLVNVPMSGEATFAKKYAGTQLLPPLLIEEASDSFYLSGVTNVSMNPETFAFSNDSALLNVSLADGETLSSAVLDVDTYELPFFPRFIEGRLYANVLGKEDFPLGDTTSVLLSMPENLSSATGADVWTTSGSAPSHLSYDEVGDKLLLSYSEGNKVAALSIDRSLDFSNSCLPFTTYGLPVGGGVVSESISLTLNDAAVTAVDHVTPKLSTTFDIRQVLISESEFCSDPDGGGSGDGGSGDGGSGDGGSGDGGDSEYVIELVGLEIFNGVSETGFSFESETGVTYRISTSEDLITYDEAAVLVGDGTVLEYSFDFPVAGSLFFKIEKIVLEN